MALVSKSIQVGHTSSVAYYLHISLRRKVLTRDIFVGLYRYLVGDILRVRRFIKNYPTFEFVQRKGVLLSVDIDKTDEVELQVVIEKASRFLEETSMNLVDYTSIVDFSSIPGHYVVYWEIKNNG